jgi:hypothetical protein
MVHDENACKKCRRRISRYSIDRVVRHGNMDAVRTYYIKLCWGCSYFSIYPNVRDDFTNAIIRDKFMLLELIENKTLKPII